MSKSRFHHARCGARSRGQGCAGGGRQPKPPELSGALWLAGASMARVCLRLAGSPRVLAGLRICASEPGREWILSGAKSRDRLPPDGSVVQAVIRMEERVLTFQAKVLGCSWERLPGTGVQPMIRLGWPMSPPLQQGCRDRCPAS